MQRVSTAGSDFNDYAQHELAIHQRSQGQQISLQTLSSEELISSERGASYCSNDVEKDNKKIVVKVLNTVSSSLTPIAVPSIEKIPSLEQKS